MTFTAVSAAKLRALNKTKILAQTYGLLAFLSAATGTILVFHYKIQGAILSLLLANGILAILLTWKTKKII
jgi:O-antigen/teichoic acid export membrane protein